jgi:hypothetical protein
VLLGLKDLQVRKDLRVLRVPSAPRARKGLPVLLVRPDRQAHKGPPVK